MIPAMRPRPAPPESPGCKHDQGDAQRRAQAWHEARAPGVDAADLVATRRQPVLHRRLFNIGQAVEPRNQPVTARQHFAGNLSIAPLVRPKQRPRAEEHEPANEREHGACPGDPFEPRPNGRDGGMADQCHEVQAPGSVRGMHRMCLGRTRMLTSIAPTRRQ